MSAENDLVLIYFEDKPLSFARIESIEPDHKPDWYHVRLLLLQVPVQIVTWILRSAYIEGAEFTMNGKRMRLEKVKPPAVPIAHEKGKKQPAAPGKPKAGGQPAKVISLSQLKKDR